MLYSGFSIDYNVVCSTGGGPDAGCRRGWKAMTEREKMLSGALYWAGAPELVQARRRAKELCSRFNQEAVQDPEAGARLLRELLGEAGDDISIQPMFWCDYGCNIRMGSQIEINHNCVILDCAPVAFGDHVFIGPNCGFYTAGHPLDAAPRNAGLEFARPITVGDNVWFGGNVAVLPGVTIGSGAVIGAGSVVSRDVPPNVVAAGSPCRVLRPIPPGGTEEPYPVVGRFAERKADPACPAEPPPECASKAPEPARRAGRRGEGSIERTAAEPRSENSADALPHHPGAYTVSKYAGDRKTEGL